MSAIINELVQGIKKYKNGYKLPKTKMLQCGLNRRRGCSLAILTFRCSFPSTILLWNQAIQLSHQVLQSSIFLIVQLPLHAITTSRTNTMRTGYLSKIKVELKTTWPTALRTPQLKRHELNDLFYVDVVILSGAASHQRAPLLISVQADKVIAQAWRKFSTPRGAHG